MTNGIFRPRQSVQRVTANAGNRAFIAGGMGSNRVRLAQPKMASEAPRPPAAPPAAGGATS